MASEGGAGISKEVEGGAKQHQRFAAPHTEEEVAEARRAFVPKKTQLTPSIGMSGGTTGTVLIPFKYLRTSKSWTISFYF